MEYITYLDINGVRGDIPVNQVGNGAPTTSTVGAVGQFYMDKSTEDYTIYKCVNARNGIYTWVPFAVSGGEVSGDYVPLSGHTPNQMMATDANGDFVLMDIPTGGGSSGDSPITLIENTDSSNRVPLRSLSSGTYVLKGYFTAFEGSAASYTFSTGMLVAVVVSGGITYVQIFYPKNNTIQYLEITDDDVVRQDAKLINMASVANMVTQVDADSDDSHYPTAKAVYDALSGVGGGSVELDTTLTQEGQAADAKAVGDKISEVSEAKVNLPTNEDGTPNHGTVGYYAVSDGAGGITWVASGNTGGDSGGEDTVTTENLKDTAGYCDSPFVSGYSGTLNEDAETYNATMGSVSFSQARLETSGGYYIVYFGQTVSGGILHISFDTELITKLETKMLLSNRPITPTWYVSERINIPVCLSPLTFTGTSGEIVIKTYDTDETLSMPSLNLTGSADITIPTGYYPVIMFRRNSSVVTDSTINSNNLFTKYVYDNVSITHEGVAVSPEMEVTTVDEDYAMDYGVSATALITDTASTTKIVIDSAYAAVIEEAKNAWMLECNGNVDKIPLIVHTDQHSYYTSSELFDFIAEIVDWYDVGKVINLGDTAGSWVDADTEHPTLSCTALENYLTATASVPFSKRIEVFGNHDTWGENADGTGRYTPQNYLYKYFRNIYARRADNYGNFVVYDDNYNVKYLAVSGMAYDSELGGYSHYVINPDSIRWIIAELEKADGYDVVILSHVPLGVSSAEITNPIDGTSETKGVGGVNAKLLTGLWSGRKDKTSGTVTDEYGTTYEFDFTSCDGELLCGLHGHIHADGYYYIDNLLDAYFDCYYQSPKAIHFVIVDRENRRLNVWKVDDSPAYQNYQIPFDKPTA